jgi:hypothetical protein
MKEALDILFSTHPHLKGQPEDKLMAFIFKYISQPAIEAAEYNELHTAPIVETDIEIDVDNFLQEIETYKNNFSHWGDTHKHFPRYGIPLVNLTGKLDEENDPSRMPLDEHFMEHQNIDNILFDHEIDVKTELCSLPSLKPLIEVFDEHLCRSAILRWDAMGHFKKHVDVIVPSPNLRLWGTTSTEMQLKMDDKIINNIKPGKIYIFDSSLVHEAHAIGNNIYQFFIGLKISAYDTMMSRRI